MSERESFPLTPLQRSMVLASMRTPRSGVYVIQDICDLPEALNPEALRQAWREVSRRHAALRAGIHSAGPELRLRVQAEPEFCWQEQDWSDIDAAGQGRTLEDFLREDRRRGFGFGGEIPMRFTLLRRADKSYTLVWTSHHVLLDGRSYLTVWREWFASYDGLLRGEDIRLGEAGHFRRHLDWIGSQDWAAAETYWRERLRASPQTTDTITDQLRAHTPGAEGFGKQGLALAADVTDKLWEFAGRHDITVNTLILGAWALLLSRYSGRADVVFGVTRVGRRPEIHDSLAGMFINTVPFRVATSPGALTAAWLKQIRTDWIGLREFEHAPLDRIRDWSGVPAGASLFDTVVVYDHEPPGESLRRLGGNWAHRTLQRRQRTDSTLTLAACGRPQIAFDLIYDERLFHRQTIGSMARRLATLLESLADVRTLGETGRAWHIAGLNQTAAPHPQDSCAHRLFERQARRTPERVALEHDGAEILYAEANRRANRLARFLRERGAGEDDLIALWMDRTPGAAIAALAVLKAGSAFLPLEPSMPPARLAAVLADARPKFLLCGCTGAPEADAACGVVSLAQYADEIAGQCAEDLPDHAGPRSPAYAICTSGSTGRPKIVINSHRALVNHTVAVSHIFGITPADRRLQFASLGSDMFVAEIFNYLCSGAALVFGIGPRGATLAEFARLLETLDITITGISSTWFGEWVTRLTAGEGQPPAKLRALIVGMERVNPAVYAAWKRLYGGRVRWFNAYGPAETSPTTLIYEGGASEWEGQSCIPIGRPIANTQAYVMDGAGNVTPEGVAGELWIGGDGVSLGYLNAPELTAQKFIPDRFRSDPEGRLYRTGDVVFRLPDGNLVFLGRTDRQVKIRGLRVELDEVEDVLAQEPSVRECAVTLENGRNLSAYVTVRAGGTATVEQLRLHLARRLPPYMIPVEFYELAEMPRTAGGKIDRLSLDAGKTARLPAGAGAAEPATPTEKRLAMIWRNALGGGNTSATDDFFASGGDSLRATVLLAQIQEEFGTEISFTTLARAPSIARLAAILEEGGPRADGGVAALQPHGTLPPFFAVSPDADPFCFLRLARHIGRDQPLFGVGNRVGLEDAGDIGKLASRVCAAIREVRPRGPYALGGYCFGGTVAFEAAHQLIAAGESVTLLALFDTPAPGYPKVLRAYPGYQRQMRQILLGHAPRLPMQEILAHARTVGRLLWKRATPRLRRALDRNGPQPAASKEVQERIMERSVNAYVPRPLPVPIVQFLAAGHVSTRVLADPRLGWSELGEAGFQVRKLASGHDRFLETNAEELARLLEEVL